MFLKLLKVFRRHPSAPPELPSPIWRIEGPFDTTFSLALVNRQLALALDGSGREVDLCAAEGPGDAIRNQDFLAAHPPVRAMWERGMLYRRADVVMRNLYPPRVTEMNGEVRVLGPYGWEESAFPAEHMEQFNGHLDLVVTMSSFVAKVMADNGLRMPAPVVGLGVDHYRGVVPRRPTRPLGAAGFRFLHVSSCFPRKGLDVLLEAWARAFTAADDVCLVVKTFPNPHNDAAAQIAELGRRHPGHAEIVLIDEEWDDAAMAGLYLACDAVVIPSRGEGFGLPIGEAMWFERPAITTGYGGQMDFCDETTAWLVDYRFSHADTHFGLFDSVWVDPDTDDLARVMRRVHSAESIDERRRRVAAAKARMDRDYSWDAVARRMAAAVADWRSRQGRHSPPIVGWAVPAADNGLMSAMPPGAIRVLPPEPLAGLPAALAAMGASHLVIRFAAECCGPAIFSETIAVLAKRGISCVVLLDSALEPAVLRALAPQLAHCRRVLVPRLSDLNGLKDAGLTANVTLFPQQPEDWPPGRSEDPAYVEAHQPHNLSARLWAMLQV